MISDSSTFRKVRDYKSSDANLKDDTWLQKDEKILLGTQKMMSFPVISPFLRMFSEAIFLR